MGKISILLVEDFKIVRDGLIRMFETQDDIEVIGAVESGLKALDLLENGLTPDIVLADLNMPGMNGIELTQKICSLGLSNTKVVILTMHAKRAFVEKAFEAGAIGYLLKDGNFEEMYKAIRKVNKNEQFISVGITS
jgi:DNA-binding NarL/FixJ family response regulator